MGLHPSLRRGIVDGLAGLKRPHERDSARTHLSVPLERGACLGAATRSLHEQPLASVAPSGTDASASASTIVSPAELIGLSGEEKKLLDELRSRETELREEDAFAAALASAASKASLAYSQRQAPRHASTVMQQTVQSNRTSSENAARTPEPCYGVAATDTSVPKALQRSTPAPRSRTSSKSGKKGELAAPLM
eukprot:6214567-Pleurochrysis_carterae.AAC.4